MARNPSPSSNLPSSDLKLLGELLDSATTYSLRDLCERCDVPAEYIIDMVEFGIVEPSAGGSPTEWRFACQMLLRARKAQRLHQDLSLDLPGLAMSLELLDEVESLRRQVAQLQLQLRRFHRDE